MKSELLQLSIRFCLILSIFSLNLHAQNKGLTNSDNLAILDTIYITEMVFVDTGMMINSDSVGINNIKSYTTDTMNVIWKEKIYGMPVKKLHSGTKIPTLKPHRNNGDRMPVKKIK